MFVCARVYIFVCVCLCLFVWCRRPTTRASHEFALADVESSQKIMSEKWARFRPPLLKYSRFLVSAVAVAITVTRTHAQAYAHAHTHAQAAHFNTSVHSHTHIQTHAQNTCMVTHAHMQTHIDTWTHTKTQVIDTKDIDIDALALKFVTNHSLNAE